MSPPFHTASQGIGPRTAYSNFVYNHISHFAAAGEAVCKSLFLNGVTRRFPTLQLVFLEGGVGWACTLYSDLIQALDHTNPAHLNLGMLADYVQRYGPELLGGVEAADDFARCEITRPVDIRDLFVPNFYFGCEPDDPVNAWAFRRQANPFRVQLHANMGSDIGHFDCGDMAEVLPEAHQLVDEGLLSEEDFRDFVFGNSVRSTYGTNMRSWEWKRRPLPRVA